MILEGVETEATAATARALGIELAQGYYFGRPSPRCGMVAGPHDLFEGPAVAPRDETRGY